MLTKEAFNALLKTLEEPPAHAIFILATTEPHKVPVTILSRCQRYDFRRIPTGVIQAYLAKLADRKAGTSTPKAWPWWPGRRRGACGTPRASWTRW